MDSNEPNTGPNGPNRFLDEGLEFGKRETGCREPGEIDKEDRSVSQVELAWVAGVFEGEGNINLHFDKRYNVGYGRLTIKMCDRDVLEKVQKIVGGLFKGSYKSLGPNGHLRKDGKEYSKKWLWQVNGRAALPVIKRIFPFLCSRRKAEALRVFGPCLNAYSQRRASP